MANLDDSEKDAKISDSAYSNCSNSQCRRSHSSKSTHSGSNSSGSSGYGGKQSTSGSGSKIVPTSKKEKEEKRKRAFEKPALLECRPPEPLNDVKNMKEDKLESMDVTPPISMPEIAVDKISLPMDQDPTTDEVPNTQTPVIEVLTPPCELEGFSCAISMQDGVVMYATQNLAANLGFPKDMWIGRSFIEFLHPLDRDTFASQTTNRLAIQKIVKTAPAEQQEKNQPTTDLQECKMACRIRRHRTLSVGFAVKNRAVSYVPFVLKISFKEIKDDSGSTVYLIIKAIPLYSAYKSPNEILVNPASFVIRHSATGGLDYIDIESVPYLGYLPQDVHNQDALMMYHPDDLPVLKTAYETIVKQGGLAKSIPYRIMAQNGDYVKLETEWTSFTNPWSLKLEFVIGKHYVLEGPTTPDVFKAPPPPPDKAAKITDEEKQKIEAADLNKKNILMVLKEVLAKPAETAKQQVTKRVQEIATIIERLLEEPKVTEELRIDTQDGDIERDSVMLGGISPHHEYKDSISSSGTPLSYNQLNFNENLQRYFSSHLEYDFDANAPPVLSADDSVNLFIDQKLMAEAAAASRSRLSPMAQNSTDSLYISSTSSMTSSTAPAASDCPPVRLTESLLIKHNNEMEKELAKIHREGRSTCKTDRTSDNRQKKKEHLARCNASFQQTPTSDVVQAITTLKRPLKDTSDEIPAKQPFLHQATNKPAPPQPLSSTFNLGIPLPIYYPQTEVPVSPKVEKPTSIADAHIAQNRAYPQISQLKYQPTQMPWSFPQPVERPMSLRMQKQQIMAQSNKAYVPSPINLTVNKPPTSMDLTEEAVPSTSVKITEPEPKPEPQPKPEPPKPIVGKEAGKPSGPSDEDNICRTDDETSYSSFYSSFVRTESGSMSSSDPKKPRLELPKKEVKPGYTYEPMGAKKTPRRKIDPPWLEQINETLDFQYKYQIPMLPKDETMKKYAEKVRQLGQPLLVSNQLGQLYLDLHLEGATSRLTLEEGITSSSSSGESSAIRPNARGRKREYTKLNLIYEENAPLPSPSASDNPIDIDPSPAPSEIENNSYDADIPTSS